MKSRLRRRRRTLSRLVMRRNRLVHASMLWLLEILTALRLKKWLAFFSCIAMGLASCIYLAFDLLSREIPRLRSADII